METKESRPENTEGFDAEKMDSVWETTNNDEQTMTMSDGGTNISELSGKTHTYTRTGII